LKSFLSFFPPGNNNDVFIDHDSMNMKSDGHTGRRENLKLQAEKFLQAGFIQEAARMYEQLLAHDVSCRRIIAPLVIDLYIMNKQPEKALECATAAMNDMPDSIVFIAEVYTRLNMCREAELLLEKELPRETSLERRIKLLHLLTRSYVKSGHLAAAENAARQAFEIAKGTIHETAVKKWADLIQP
jgi:lipopolysaccharide biosynthesis regulator YciM